MSHEKVPGCFPDCKKIIGSGVCKADCCGPVPFPPEKWAILRFKAVRPISEVMDFCGQKLPLGNDTHCVFLNKDWTCAVYEDRPEVCRLFGDSRQISPMLKCPHVQAKP